MHYALHQLYFKIKEWRELPLKEKAFYIASITLRIEHEEKERKKMAAKTRKR